MTYIMAEVLGKHYMYEYVLTLNKSVYGLVQTARFWFKGYINPMTLKVGFKSCYTYPCPLYRLN